MDDHYAGELPGSVWDECIIFQGLDPWLGVDDVLDASVSLKAGRLHEGRSYGAGAVDGHVELRVRILGIECETASHGLVAAFEGVPWISSRLDVQDRPLGEFLALRWNGGGYLDVSVGTFADGDPERPVRVGGRAALLCGCAAADQQ